MESAEALRWRWSIGSAPVAPVAEVLATRLGGILIFVERKLVLGDNGRRRHGASEAVFARINGVRQGMFIQSKDSAQPVLLYLHGGLPDYFLTERYPTGLERDFTVVWWEQRGAGLSYSPSIPPETMTLEQFIADTLSVTDYLRDRFSKEKIYLMAHSGGTFIGLQAAARAPEGVSRLHWRGSDGAAAQVRAAGV